MKININTHIDVTNYIWSKKFYMKNSFKADKCSEELGISTDVFLDVLNENFQDTNLKRLAIELRIDDTKYFLSRKLSIKKISKLCGFSNILIFIYYFKKVTNVFPSTWRKYIC